MCMWYRTQFNNAPFVDIGRSCWCAIAAACIGLLYAAAGLGFRHAAAGLGLCHVVAGLGLCHAAVGVGLCHAAVGVGLCHAAATAAAAAARDRFSERNSCLFCWFGCVSLRSRWSFL